MEYIADGSEGSTGREGLESTIHELPNQDGFDLYGVLNAAYGFAGVLAVIFVIVGGIQYVLSNGSPEKASKALHMIIYALVGLAIVLAATVITNFIFGNIK